MAWLVLATPLLAQEEAPALEKAGEAAAGPLTNANPEIPVDHLDLLLDPLTKDELLVEAVAWRDLIKAKVREVSQVEIATREKSKEIAETRKAAEAGGGAPAGTVAETQKKAEKDRSLETLTRLREEKAALLKRFKTVLDAYEAKGGDPEEFRKYASAVSGIKVEVTDAGATWSAIEGWVTSKEGGLRWGLRLVQFLGIMLAFWVLALAVGTLVRKGTARNKRMSDLLKRFLNMIVQRTILFVGLLVALSTLGVNVGAFLALLGGGAFILGFALQDTLGNFASGLMLLLYRPFDVGDAVGIGGVLGKVDNVSLVNTTIRTFDNQIVLVPNKQVWGQVITNITGADVRRVDMVFGIGYDDDIDKAEEILGRVVAEHELVLEEPAPAIELHELGESSVNFICRPWTRTAEFWRVRWDITKRVKKEFDAAGITIPFPQRDVHLHQPAPVSPDSEENGKGEKLRAASGEPQGSSSGSATAGAAGRASPQTG